MNYNTNCKLEAITRTTLIVGIDIAKHIHWARFVNSRGTEVGKPLKFQNDINGFKSIVAKIREICEKKDFGKIIVGMEPTGHYWKPLANRLIIMNMKVVMINPYHTKRAKELDDNSPTKSDRKDALTIAKLTRDGRYYEVYMPKDEYADLRVLSNTRIGLMKRHKSLSCTINAILDEYFPEIWTVFKYPIKGKVSMQIMKECPFPRLILEKGIDGIFLEIRKAVKRSVGMKKAKELIEIARQSIGVEYGMESAKMRLNLLLEELELVKQHLRETETSMERVLEDTGIKDIILSVKGVGVVNAAQFLGEIGDPMRFSNPKQISRMAGYSLVEDSSGKNQSGTVISKRGRKNLRSVLYRMAMVMVAQNNEMKKLYNYLKTRKENPLKAKQALVAVSNKIIVVIHTIIKKRVLYDANAVFGHYRRTQMQNCA